MALVVTIAIGGFACGDRVRALREHAAKTYAAIADYEVVSEIINGGGQGDRMVIRQAMRKPDSYRLEALEPAEIKGQLTIRNGRALWVYDPAASELFVSGISTANYDSNARIVLADVMSYLANADNVKFVRSERGESGILDVVEYPDPVPDQGGSYVRLWADAKTGVPQRVEYLYEDGTVAQTVVFRDFVVNPGLADDRFNFAIPPGTHVINDDSATRSVSLEEARRYADFQVLLPDRVPDGFELSDVSLIGSDEDLTVALSYTSGERLIQLYECKYSSDSGMSGATRQVVDGVEYSVDAAEGFATIGWTRDGVSVSITADLQLEELFTIAQSLK